MSTLTVNFSFAPIFILSKLKLLCLIDFDFEQHELLPLGIYNLEFLCKAH